MASIPYSGQGLEGFSSIPMGGVVPEDYEKKINKGAANGYAPLGSDSKVPIENLPNLGGYQQESEKNLPNGYAGLGADGKIALSQLPDANALESEAIAFAIALG